MRAAAVAVAACLSPAPSAAAAPGTQVKHKLTVTDSDPKLGKHDRVYQLALPYDEDTPNATYAATKYPLLFYMHGQLLDSSTSARAVKLSSMGVSEGFITVAPQGLADGFPLGLDTGWSVKAEGRTDVCKRTSPQYVMKSCHTTGRVSNCNWATCYDDVLFIKTLLSTLQNDMKLPIDPARIYMIGPSNGAMMIDYLVTQLPGTFAAAVPWYGAFLEHYLSAQDQGALAGTSLLSLHGAQDALIPPGGGEDTQAHYLYVPEATKVAAWAASNGCDSKAVKVVSPFSDSGDKSMVHTCTQHPNCKHGTAVMYCEFPKQGHGFWPQFGEKMTWWFLSSKVLATA